jgi:hypothetical protein
MRGRSLAGVVGLMLFVASCGGGNAVEELLESQEGIDNVEFDKGEASFTITDDEGNTVSVTGDDETLTVTGDDGEIAAVFGGGEVPDGFPIPILPGGTVQSVIETPQGALLILEFSTAGFDYDTLVAYYEAFSEESGITVVTSTKVDATPKFSMWSLEKGDAVYSILITDAIDGVMLVQLTAE